MDRTPVAVLRGGSRQHLVDRLRVHWDDGTPTWVVDPTWPATRVAALGGGLLADAVEPLWHDGEARVSLDIPTDTATIVTSSGTTGDPKVVVLAASALHASADGAHAYLAATSSDRWLLALPLHHVAGQSVVWRSRRLGHDPVVQDGLDAPTARAAGVTLAALVPTQLRRMVDTGGRLDATVLLGGGSISPALLADTAAGGHARRVVRSYGLTETAGGCVYDGWAFPGTEVAAPDGLLDLRGPTLAAGRLTTAGLRAIVDDAGWLHTRDVGDVGSDGEVTVTGRADDVIVTGGVKVAPAAVEVVIEDHPAVARAGVVGLPDPEWGEVVAAAVVTTGPFEVPDLRARVRAALNPAAVPRLVVVVDDLRLTALGKVDRRALRDRLGPHHT